VAFLSAPFDQFDEVVLGDSEFVARPGELLDPVTYAFKELRSGRSDSIWYDKLGPEPPHAHGPNVLFVGFTGAEPEFFGSIGWPFDMAFLDLRVEGIRLTNLAIPRSDPRHERLPRSLISFLRWLEIPDGDAALKDRIRARIIEGKPFTDQERGLILRYCLDDVLLLEKLMRAMLPGIGNLRQALMRGEYVKFTAETFVRGIPADPWSTGLLRPKENRQAIRLRAVSDTSLTHGLYEGASLKQARMKEFVVRHQLQWRKTRKAGKLGTAYHDFVELEQLHPEFNGLADITKTVDQLRELQLFPGNDKRFRTPIWAFSTITSRSAPNGAAYPCATPAWCRYTIIPPQGHTISYLDFSSMEFGVAAGLSNCSTMLSDYAREPYLTLPILLGLIEPHATKATHGPVRDRFKPMILALQYGGGPKLVAHRLGLSEAQGSRLVELHHQRYEDYWSYSDRRLQIAFEKGELVAPDGWRTGVDSRTSIFTARNWFIQCTSAAIFRYGGLLMRHIKVPVIALVHDAVAVEAPDDRIEYETLRARECLERASRRFLRGLTLGVDVKCIHAGERFTDPRGERTWSFVERCLHELETGLLSGATEASA
jgi:hypothetical protein